MVVSDQVWVYAIRLALPPTHDGLDDRLGMSLRDLAQRQENVVELLVHTRTHVLFEVDITVLSPRLLA